MTDQKFSADDTIADQVVILDYQEFRKKHLLRCQLVYRGGRPPTLIECHVDSCIFIFENEAKNTLEFLQALGTGNTGGRELVLHGLLGFEEDE